ncbi:MAG: Hint domain-containing protein [Thermoplasmata archaeon]
MAAPINATSQPSPICGFALSDQAISRAVGGLNISLTAQERTSTIGQIGSLYANMCNNAQAVALVQYWGVANASLNLFGSATAGVVFANFSLNWANWDGSTLYSVEQYWSMDLKDGQLAGPFARSVEDPSGLNGGVPYGSSYSNPDWAGWELQGGSNSPEIYGTYANTPVIPMSSEGNQQTNEPAGASVDSVAAVWVGFENELGQSSNSPYYMVQTGYTYDATHPSDSWCASFTDSCDYGLWWLYLVDNSGSGGLTGAAFGAYSGDPTVPIGNTLTPEVYVLDPGEFQASIWDDSTNLFWDHVITGANVWQPTYAQFIVEAPVSGYGDGYPDYTQIAGFPSQPVTFGSGALCMNTACASPVSPYTAYQNGWYQMDTLNQENGANTAESFSGSTPEVTWITSSFNYCGLDPSYNIRCTESGGGGGGGCVAYGTPILTPTGYVPVQNLKPGHAVEEYDFSSRSLVQGTFTSGNITHVNQAVNINNGWLALTPTDQPIFIKNSTFSGWLHDPQNLTTADSIFDPVTQTWIHVTSVKLVDLQATVYDVVTTYANNFVANGALLNRKI